MIESGIVLDDYKLPVFKKHLDASPFKYEVVGKFTEGSVMIRVYCEQADMDELTILVRKMNEEGRRLKTN